MKRFLFTALLLLTGCITNSTKESIVNEVHARNLELTQDQIKKLREAETAFNAKLAEMDLAKEKLIKVAEDSIRRAEEYSRKLLNELQYPRERKFESNDGVYISEIADAQLKKRLIIKPVMMIEEEDKCGSAVILHRAVKEETKPESPTYEYYALTAYHVVRDFAGKDGYHGVVWSDAGREDITFRVITSDSAADLTLIRFTSKNELSLARLAEEKTQLTLDCFMPVYLVGFPLGIGPFHTRGEIVLTAVYFEDRLLMIVNAPGFFGNSGGGVFHAETLELIGFFNKIYTFRNLTVTHMGYAVNLQDIYKFLRENGYGSIAEQRQKTENLEVTTAADK